MSGQAAFLRAVNVGGRKVTMAELKRVCEAAGCADVRTLLASGNVALKAKPKGAKLEAKLEQAVEKALGLKSEVFVRDSAEMDAILAANPFRDFAQKDPSHMIVFFMRAAPSAAEKKALEAPQGGPERLKVVGREAFVIYPANIGRSEFKIKALGTMRNWNTVTKMADLIRG